ncbi:aquaporin-like protein [Gongronella butleri]|nr:aquaporin-like protein [Gongronella butleri]
MSTNLRVKLRETFLNGEAPKPNLRADLLAAFAELIGMTIFIFLALAGVQAALEAPKTETGGPTVSQIQSVAFSFGTGITVGLFVCAPYSGGALNPAVLLCLLITRQMSWMRGALIFIAEIVGAILGAYFANWTTANILQGVNALNPGFNYAQGFFAEMLLTFVLCAVVLFVIVENQEPLVKFAPIVVGLTVFMCHMIGTPIDGTSINPARSFGAAVVTGRWANSWIFWFGPLIGGFFATIVYFIHKGFTNAFVRTCNTLGKKNALMTLKLTFFFFFFFFFLDRFAAAH